MEACSPKRILTILLILTAANIVSCSPTGSPSNGYRGGASQAASALAPFESDGTQHTGGGSVLYSTPEQVNSVLDLALKLASEPDIKKNIIVDFWKTDGHADGYDFIMHPVHLFPLMGSAMDFGSPPIEALKVNKIVRIPKGDCPHPKAETNADASVSDFNLSATICFSIGNLQRIPPSALLREILSLVVHEVSHLGGADEPEAKIWQSEFLAYFGKRFEDLSPEKVLVDTLRVITEARLLIERAKLRASANVNDQRIFGIFSAITTRLGDLPDFRDSLALELKLNPAHPELIDAYKASVIQMTGQRVKFIEGFITVNLHEKDGLFIAPDVKPVDRVDVGSKIAEFEKGIEHIYDSFVAFLGAPLALKSDCMFKPAEGQNSSENDVSLKLVCTSQPAH